MMGQQTGLQERLFYEFRLDEWVRAVLLGHTKLESTVRYLGIEVDDALSISEQVEL
jgi:hypothetical protein